MTLANEKAHTQAMQTILCKTLHDSMNVPENGVHQLIVSSTSMSVIRIVTVVCFSSRSCLWHECIQLASRYFELLIVGDMSERAVPDVSEVSVDIGLV